MSPTLKQPALHSEALSFHDLRQFAESARHLPLSFEAAPGTDAFLARRSVLPIRPGPALFGTIFLEAGGGAVPSMPADEFVIIVEGALTLSQAAHTVELKTGGCAVLQCGASLSWRAEQPVSLIFMRYNASQAGDRMLLPIRSEPPLAPSASPSAELLISRPPTCRSFTDYRSADGAFYCGTWDSTPYKRRTTAYSHYELMHLLHGSVTLEDASGRRATFTKGDVFMVERGAECAWESLEHVKKVYAVCRPA